jgi:hypothetical protein
MSSGLRLGVIVCDPGDRPEFKEQYDYLIRYQTRKAHVVYIVADPKSDPNAVDIVPRLRAGCEFLKNLCDLIVVIENDDFYSRNYFERMATLWERHGRPDLIGFSQTIYYHLLPRAYMILNHPGRASLFSTCIAARAVDKIGWPREDEKFVDLKLWRQLKGVAAEPANVDCIGIKHGLGKTVSMGQKAERYTEGKSVLDSDLEWLKMKTMSAFGFYKGLSEKLRKEIKGA